MSKLREISFSEEELIKLRELFDKRYSIPLKEWPKSFPKAILDCEGLAHYITKGKIGEFTNTETSIISQVDVNSKNEHKPYTGYEIWRPHAPWVRKEDGFWGAVHFFTYLEDGVYISTNGCGPIRFFESYKEMLSAEAFPHGYVTADERYTNDIEQAMIGESMICTISEV